MDNINVIILNYGSGNVASVFSMVNRITNKVKISNEVKDIKQASHFILPGVGSFGDSVRKVKEKLPFDLLEDRILKEKIPFLGICVGMQMLFTKSEEFGQSYGFNWIEGDVVKINKTGLPIPHVGWNDLTNSQDNNFVESGVDMYFIHSYKVMPKDIKNIISYVNYGEEICAIVRKDNIFGVQFHPEKSQLGGKKLIRNFLEE